MPNINIRWSDNTKDLTANLKQGLNQIEATRASAEKMARSLGGENLIRAAHNYVAAVQQVGGANKLTAAEQERVNATLQKAIDKYTALGKTAPQAMRNLSDELKRLSLNAEALKKSAETTGGGGLFGNLSKLTGALSSVGLSAGTLGVGTVVASLAASARAAMNYADSLTRLADTTGISISALQRLQAVAEPSGNTLEDVAGAVNKFQKNITTGNPEALSALTKLGLSLDALKALSPDEQFFAIAKAIQSIKDPAQQTTIAMQLFGRAGAELLPTLKADVDKLKDSTFQMSESSVKALDDFGDKMSQVGRSAVNVLGEIAGAALVAASKVIELSGALPSAPGAAAGAPIPGSGLLSLDEAKAKAAALTGEITFMGKAVKESTVGLVQGFEQGSAAVDGLHQAFAEFAEQAAEKAAAALRAFNQNLEDVIATAQGYQSLVDSIDGSVVEAIRSYRDQGVSLDRLATMYGLTKVQVEGLTQAFKLEEEALKRIVALNAANAAPTSQQPHFDVSQGELPGLDKLRAYVKEVERARAVEAEIGQRGAQGIEKIGEAAAVAAPKARDLFDSLRSLAHLDFGTVFNDIGKFLKGGIGQIGTGFLQGIGRDIQSKLFDLAEQGLKKLWDKAKDIFGGPSPAEQAGRAIVASFQKQFASTADMINKVGAAYIANGQSAAQAQAAIQRLWAAEKQGAAATKRALEEINEVLKRQQEITDAIHGEGFQSQDEIRHAADIANAAYEEMLRSGQYTQAQVEEAYRHYQELLAQLEGAAGEAARAWLEAHKSADDAVQASSDAMQSAEADLKAALDRRNQLAAGLAKEAKEDQEGVIEQQQREELAALDKQIQEKADAYAKLADETGQRMADAIVEALRNIHIDPVHVPVVVDTSGIPRDFPRYKGEQPEPVSRGGWVGRSGVSYFAGGYMPSFRPIGTDIIPAMLTPGEMVLTASQQAAIGSLLAQSPGRSGGGAGGGVVVQFGDIHVQATGAELRDMEAFAPKFTEALRRDTGGLRTTIENTARKVTR